MIVQTVLDDAFDIIGVTNPTANQYAKGVRFFNNFLSTRSTEEFAVVTSTEDTLTLVSSTASYTYGTGGDLNSARPTYIKEYSLKDIDDDYSQITKLTEKEYNDIVSKDTEGKPTQVYYKPGYPLGTLFPYPVPDTAYTLYIYANKRIETVTAIDETLSVPDEYIPYFVRNMVFELAHITGYIPTRDDHLLARRTGTSVKSTKKEPHKTEVSKDLFFL